jgi:phosphatidylserine synthase
MWFKGLPSPGAAAAITMLVLLLESLIRNGINWAVPIVFWILPPATLAAALLMVSNVPYPHGTNHFLGGRHRFGNLVTALLVISLLLVFQQHTLVLVSVAYVLLGPAIQFYRKLFSRDRRSVDDLVAEVVAEEDDDDSPEATDASGESVE